MLRLIQEPLKQSVKAHTTTKLSCFLVELGCGDLGKNRVLRYREYRKLRNYAFGIQVGHPH